jgi:hypothetical protein
MSLESGGRINPHPYELNSYFVLKFCVRERRCGSRDSGLGESGQMLLGHPFGVVQLGRGVNVAKI